MEQFSNYPWEIKPLTEEESDGIYKYQTGARMEYVRVGPSGCLQYSDFVNTGPQIYNLVLRPTDVFVVTFPRSGVQGHGIYTNFCVDSIIQFGRLAHELPASKFCSNCDCGSNGTTWAQELVWLIVNDFDYKTAAEVNLTKRFPFLEFLPLFNNRQLKQWMTRNDPKNLEDYQELKDFSNSITETLSNMESPRFIKSHLPLYLLPPTLLNTAKVVYVARDPRDVAVSFYHHHRLFKMFGFTGDFKTYWKLFLEDKVIFAPYFPHVKEAWERRHHPNMLFLFYEELSKDLPAAVHRVAQFLEKPITEEQVRKLCDHLHIDNFRQNKSVNMEEMKEIGMVNTNEKSTFIRKGKTGGWPAYFDEEMTAQAEHWIEENLRGTGISFP